MYWTQTQTEEKSMFRDLCLVLFASFAMALSKIAIPLWFTPVPIVLQNSVVLLLAALLGPRRAVAATFCFLVQGALGLPVFASGALGWLAFIGPTGGYLIGYLAAAFITGYLAEKTGRLTAAVLIGNGVVYLFGAAYLAAFVGLSKAFTIGVAPFILGDLVKIGLGIRCAKWLKDNCYPLGC